MENQLELSNRGRGLVLTCLADSMVVGLQQDLEMQKK